MRDMRAQSDERDRSPVPRALAWAGFLALLALHLDFWRERRDVIWFSWMPEDLAWRLCWMLAAILYLLFFCRFVWREDS